MTGKIRIKPLKSKKANTIYNSIMAMLLVAIVFSGAMFVGSVRGWFSEESSLRVTEKTGLSNINRKGIAYSLKEGVSLQRGDQLVTLDGSKAVLETDSGKITLHENTQVEVVEAKGDELSLKVIQGEVFFDLHMPKGESLETIMGEERLVSSSGVYSVSVPSGTKSVYVYGGSVQLEKEGETVVLNQGEMLTILEDQTGVKEYLMGEIKAEGLNDFILNLLQNESYGVSLFFTEEELAQVVAKRQASLILLEEERKDQEEHALAQGNDGVIPVEPGSVNDKEEPSERGDTPSDVPKDPSNSSSESSSPEETLPVKEETPSGGGSSSSESSKPKDPIKEETPPATTPPKEDTPPSVKPPKEETPSVETPEEEDKKPPVEPPKVTKPTPKVLKATISIRVDSILSNMGELTVGKEKYVPQNGVILKASSVGFYEGETVFDVLKRATKAAGIQLEYAYVPLYESYYVEGINHLYQFDVGSESGWMYKVNGWFPNYGSSAYKLKDGDVIVWAYTCKGLGADIGGSVN